MPPDDNKQSNKITPFTVSAKVLKHLGNLIEKCKTYTPNYSIVEEN